MTDELDFLGIRLFKGGLVDHKNHKGFIYRR
jgi:hypothetical protein